MSAIDGLLLARSEKKPETITETSMAIRQEAVKDHAVKPIRGRFFQMQGSLHSTCFYNGVCEPPEDVSAEITQEVAQFIEDARKLAGVK